MPSQKELDLYSMAKEALPSWLFSKDSAPHEIIWAFAKQFASVWEQIDFFVDQAFITRALGAFLDEHAKDHGTRRQDGEDDATLAERLRNLEQTVTPAALRLRVRTMLESAGYPLDADYVELVELRRDRAFYGRGPGVQFQTIAGVLIADGETFKCGNVTYEFNRTGGVTAGNTAVTITSGMTAAQVATAMVTAMTAQFGTLVNVGVSGDTVIVRRAIHVTESVANAGFTVRRKKSYFSRGYRMTGPAREGSVIIFILPYGVPQTVADSIAEALRLIKAGGIKVIIERRLSP